MGVPAADFFFWSISFCWHATAHFGVALGTSAPRACMMRLVAKVKGRSGKHDLSSHSYISFRFGARDSFLRVLCGCGCGRIVELELMTDGIILVIRVRVRSITSSATHNVSSQLVPSRVGQKPLLSRTNSTAATQKKSAPHALLRRVSLGCARADSDVRVYHVYAGARDAERSTRHLLRRAYIRNTSLPFSLRLGRTPCGAV